MALLLNFGCGGADRDSFPSGPNQAVAPAQSPSLFEQRAITLAEERTRLQTEMVRAPAGWATRDGLLLQLAQLPLSPELTQLLGQLTQETASERTRVQVRFDQRRDFLKDRESRLSAQLQAAQSLLATLFQQELTAIQRELQLVRDHRLAIFAFFAQEQSLLRQMLGSANPAQSAILQPLLDLSLKRLANATDSFLHEEDLLETESREIQQELNTKQ